MSSASGTEKQGFRVVHESAPFRGKQGHIYRPAISAEAVEFAGAAHAAPGDPAR